MFAQKPQFLWLFGIFWDALKWRDGAQGRNRTTDTVIFSHVLYQLSYLGIRGTG